MATLVNLSRSLNFWRGLVATVNRIKSEQSFLFSYLCVAKRIPSHQLLAGRFVKQTAKRKAIPAFSRPSVQKREEEGRIHRRGVCVCTVKMCTISEPKDPVSIPLRKNSVSQTRSESFRTGWLVGGCLTANQRDWNTLVSASFLPTFYPTYFSYTSPPFSPLSSSHSFFPSLSIHPSFNLLFFSFHFFPFLFVSSLVPRHFYPLS